MGQSRMRRVLVIEESTLRLLAIPGEPGLFEFLSFQKPEDVSRLLSSYRFDSLLMARLRQLIAEERLWIDVHRMTDAAVVSRVTDLVVSGRLPIARLERQRHALAEATESPSTTAPPPSTGTKKLTWIEIVIINDLTALPIPWVRMAVKVPSGEEGFYTTDADGLIRIDDIDPGTCDARCDVKNATLDDTLAFVATGAKSGDPKYPKDAFPNTTFIKRIANVEEHKVKKGETLDSLAAKASLKPEELAVFNWDAATPGEINHALDIKVGCTKKSRNGADYLFDDTDNPGIVYIPTKWEETGLASGKQHIFRVKPIVPFRLILEDEFGHRIPETPFEATFADDSKKQDKLGLSGMYGVKDPPWGPVSVVYTDYDDINAKSLAACARDCFDHRDYDDVYRVMKQGPKVIEQVLKMYDKYYNTYTGKGLTEDIYQDLSDDLALMAVVGLMAKGGLETKEKAQYVAWEPYEEDV
jgi:hypothetical protein